ncbi:Ulp1 protease family [Abeliophyllum distichum]|uniref:Ulp1 protease family n=1 Tax=Abeliophyllum distichum TaxID=126358 RepID=A0ABD1PC53_9LAMI
MAMFSQEIRLKVTTTDSFFGSMVRGLYPALLKDINAIARQMPIRMGTRAHWILGYLDIEKRCINVFNSCWGTIRDREVIADVEAFAFVIPHLMANIDVWQPAIVDGVQQIEPLAVSIVHDIPQQSNGTDCGVYMINYAKYIINDNIQDMPNHFDATVEKTRLASLLYKHVTEKMSQGYETDPDFLTRKARKAMRAVKKKKPT